MQFGGELELRSLLRTLTCSGSSTHDSSWVPHANLVAGIVWKLWSSRSINNEIAVS